MISLKAVPKKNDKLAWRIINNETVVMHLERIGEEKKDSFCILNETATRIWQLIDGEKTADDIVSCLTEDYDVDVSKLSSEVRKVIKRLFTFDFIILASNKRGAHEEESKREKTLD